jgi:Uma2 family endonuclease
MSVSRKGTIMATATKLEAFQTIEDLLEALGGIASSRVRLHPSPGTATEADLIAFNARKITICELVDGVLVEKGLGYEESNLAAFLVGLLNAFVIPRNLGIVSGADGMMRLSSGLVREPDVAFASWDRIPGRRRPKTPIAGFAPELAIEVLSRSNRKAEMARKRREYFAAGVRLVWEVNFRTRKVAVFDSPEHSITLDASQILDGGEVLPGFALPPADLFGELDRQGI